MAHQMKNLCGFSVFHCVEGAFGASSGGTPKMKATTLNLSAGLGVQRWSRGRQLVVQTQNPVVQDLLCGKSTEKVPYYRGKGSLACRGKSGQHTGNDFLALGLGVVLYLPSIANQGLFISCTQGGL